MAADILLDRQPVVKLIPQSRIPAQDSIRLHTFFNAKIRKPFYEIHKRHFPDLQKTWQFIGSFSDPCDHTVLYPAYGGTAQNDHHFVTVPVTVHKGNQLFHEFPAGLDDILKLIDHDHLLAFLPAGDPDQNITKDRERLHLISVTAHLHAPLIHLLSLRTGSGHIIVSWPLCHKFSEKSRLTDMLLPIYNNDLAAFPLIIIIQMS